MNEEYLGDGPGRPPRDMTDQVCGHLTVLRIAGKTSSGSLRWHCKCGCGKFAVVDGYDLRHGKTVSCGCVRRARLKKQETHGEAKDGALTPEYRAWAAMLTRCTNERQRGWKDYGGRGIKVCDRWASSYENFLVDMGRKPTTKHSLDRYPNVNGDYTPSNCRWATASQQRNNQRRSKHSG